ncbi:MAG: hypothetical protein ACSHW0_16550 [Thalassotalea sp.]
MNHILWNQLLSLSDELEQGQQTKAALLKVLISRLEAIEIAHERSFDPAENFEEYVAVGLCQAIKKVLTEE